MHVGSGNFFCSPRNVSIWLQYRRYQRTSKSNSLSSRDLCSLISLYQIIEEFIGNVYKNRTGEYLKEDLSDFLWALTGD